MSKALFLSPTLALPLDAVTGTFAIGGVRGAGKSNTARVMAEEMYRAGLPFVILDPVGKWYGIRSSFNGRSAGLPIPILGGAHGDIPLDRSGGKMVADLIVDNRLSCVIDLFQFESEGDRILFLTDFAKRLYRRNTEPLHIFMEEADDYIPQQVHARVAGLVGAFEDIVRRGRAQGLGCTMITNRAQGLNKAVLEMSETLIMHRTTGPRARKALEGWFDYHGQKKEVLASLPSLHDGEAWVWSPEFLSVFKRAQINRQTTFDSAATPKITKQARPSATLADVDLAAFQKRMADTIERAKETDPKHLRARVAQLDAEVARLRVEKPAKVERVEVSVLTEDDREAIEEMRLDVAQRVGTMSADMRAVAEDLDRISGKFNEAAERLVARVMPLPMPYPASRPDTSAAIGGFNPVGHRLRRPDPTIVVANGNVVLRLGERKMMEVLATRHPLTLTKTQLALLAGSSHKSSTFRAYLGTLKRNGFVETVGHEVRLTRDAVASWRAADIHPMSPADTREMWRERLRKGERDLFDAVISCGRRGIAKAELAEVTSASHKSSTFRAYLGTLKRNGLVRIENGMVYAPEELL